MTKQQLNRALAFANSGNEELGLADFSLVLEKDSKNLTALNGKAVILSDFECESQQLRAITVIANF